MHAVQEAVHRGIEMLGNSPGPAQNNQRFADGTDRRYAMPARTAAEVKVAPAASQGHVQGRGVVPQQVEAINHALANGEMDMFAHLQQAAGLQDPVQPLGQAPVNEPRPVHRPPNVQTPSGLVLPQGLQPKGAAPHVEEKGTSEWLL